jgi:hypothetical protein
MRKLVAFMAASLLVSTSGYAAVSGSAARNYDSSYSALAAASLQGGNQVAARTASLLAARQHPANLKPQGFPSHFDSRLGRATFLWAPAGSRTAQSAHNLSFSPVQPALRSETAARWNLGQQASALRLDRDSIANARLSEVHDIGHGPIIARFQQYKDGLEVFGRSLNVMMDRQLNAVATSGYFAPAPASKGQRANATGTPAFSVGAEAALSQAFADMGGRLPAAAFSAHGTAGGYTVYSAGRSSDDYQVTGTPRSKAVYYYSQGKYLPAWFVEVHAQTIDHANNDAYGYVISAVDGKVLFRKDLTDYDNYTYRVFANSAAPFQPEDQPINNNTLDPFTGGPNGDQGRTQGSFNLATLNNSGLLGNLGATSAAKNDPWLPPGATTTTGNNVDDFANIAGGDGFDPGDVRGAISSASTFDYPYTIDADPTTASQRQAAIVNQFFVDNWLHDDWYDHGFDEKSGNAQQSNYGRGGVEGDPIQAQAQDDSGRNNANMQTPPDGGSPIQRMFLWDGPLSTSSTVDITSPSSIGKLNFNTASFGPRSFSATANVLVPESGNNKGCNAITANLSGAIALIDRGTCTFKTKTLNAQNAGAAAVIIADSASHCTNPADPSTCEAAPGLGDDASITTPITVGTVSLSYPDGQKIHTALGSGAVSGKEIVQFLADRDGTMDIQIIAHEFFHHVSNRLVGNALGLSSTQGGGMGEGWSDFDSLLLTVRPEDAAVTGNDKFQGAYPLATYVTFSQYFGIRRTPYSTSMSIDPLTFKDISNGQALPATAPISGDTTGANNAEVHATGEIWCNTLWEIYASLLNDPRYTFAQAKSRMQDYIIEGLKMTPNAPTILEARDALLAAAKATDSGDFTLMAKAFAKRGMGVEAIGPDRGDSSNSGVVESYNAIAAGVQVTAATLDFNVPSTVLGDLDGDGVLDVGETARLTFTLLNDGTADMAGPVTGQMTATPGTGTAGVGFSNGGAVTVPALKIGQSEQVSVLVTLNSSSVTAQPLALTLAFPSANDPSGTIPSGGTAAVGTEYDLVANYDLQKNSTSDNISDVQANLGDWALSNNGTAGPGWEIDDFTGFFVDQNISGNAWFGPDNDHSSDITLTSPELDVAGTGSFTLAFDHFFNLEFAGFDGAGNAYGFDGGVIEVSTNGGATWSDAFGSTIGGTVTTGSGYNGFDLSLQADGTFDPTDSTSGHPGFIANNEDPNNPVLEHIVVNFGTKLAGKKVKLRFRETSDEGTGVFGWVVDNIAVTGVTNLPFSKTVPDAGKATQVPTAAAVADGGVFLIGDTVTLDGSASSDPYGETLTYAWTQTAGPAVTLTNATSAKPSFVPTTGAVYSFSLKVTDQTGHSSTNTATESVTVTAPPTAVVGNGLVKVVGEKVTLNGTGSTDPLGKGLSYAWTQTAGPTVTLTDAATATPSFTPAATGVYSFSLKVTDAAKHSSTNTAVENVLVQTLPQQSSGSGGGGGGAFAPWLLLPGLLLAGLRRRRRS